MKIKALCVFCGSSFGNDEVFRDKAVELGRHLASNDIALIYGGGGVGLMGALASAVLDGSGRVTGVIPELIYSKVKQLPLSEIIVTTDMHERKRKMYEISDAFMAMPGGVGTIEELSEIFTWQQLGYHNKAVSLYNINNFFDGFISFLDHATESGFIKPIHRERLIVENRPAELLKKLESFDARTIDKWSK